MTCFKDIERECKSCKSTYLSVLMYSQNMTTFHFSTLQWKQIVAITL